MHVVDCTSAPQQPGLIRAVTAATAMSPQTQPSGHQPPHLVCLAVQPAQCPLEFISSCPCAVQQAAQRPQHALARRACLKAAFIQQSDSGPQQAGQQGAARDRRQARQLQRGNERGEDPPD